MIDPSPRRLRLVVDTAPGRPRAHAVVQRIVYEVDAAAHVSPPVTAFCGEMTFVVTPSSSLSIDHVLAKIASRLKCAYYADEVRYAEWAYD